MADVTIDSSVTANIELTPADGRSVVAVDRNNIYAFYCDGGTDLVYQKSTDAGATWGGAVTVRALGVNIGVYSIWYDRWTPGDNGTKIHIWVVDDGVHDVIYRALDTSNDSLSAAVAAFLGASASTLSAQVSGAKARGGNLYCAYDIDGGTEAGLTRSIDGGATWDSTRASPNEAVSDYYLMFPGNEADNQDMWLVFWDRSVDELTLKTYDDSADSWSESAAFGTSFADVARSTNCSSQFNGSIRHSDNHLILTAWNARDTAGADLACWDINGAASITAKTNVVTNSDDCQTCCVFINQNNNDIYVGYLGKSDGSEVIGTNLGVYYKLSADGGTTWGVEVAYAQTATLPLVTLSCDLGGTRTRFIMVWADGGNDDLITNTVNSIEIAPGGGGGGGQGGGGGRPGGGGPGGGGGGGGGGGPGNKKDAIVGARKHKRLYAGVL